MASRDVASDTTFLSVFRGVLLALPLMSCVVNLLSLTGSLYMLQVYDRVLGSQNISTLVAFSILAASLFAFQMLLEVLRARITRRVGDRVERRLMPHAHETAAKLPLRGVTGADAQQPIRDVDMVRSYLSGQGPIAFFDLPWLPIYLAFATFLHPWIGAMTLGAVAFLIALTLASERIMSGRNARLMQLGARRQTLVDEHARNSEAAAAMGFAGRLRERFLRQGEEMLVASAHASDTGSMLASVSRVFRMMLQSAVLGLGAYLTIKGQMTGGAMIAASIISARALAPVELAIAHWRPFIMARQARRRLAEHFARHADAPATTELPAPRQRLKLESVSAKAPNGQRVLDSVSLELKAGQGLGLIGASAAGKSSLARVIMGIWPAAAGAVRIDGATLAQWDPEALGRHVGYMPQDVQLFEGTIAENISRFEPDPDSRALIAAAEAANVHGLILRLPKGYDTSIGAGGSHLSAGQRQRIALARALYRDPFLVVLDEPNSNLDGEGEAALTEAVRKVRARGGIVLLVAHRPQSLAAVDLVGVMSNGKLTAMGPRDEILRKVMRGSQSSRHQAPGNGHASPLPLLAVPAAGSITRLNRTSEVEAT